MPMLTRLQLAVRSAKIVTHASSPRPTPKTMSCVLRAGGFHGRTLINGPVPVQGLLLSGVSKLMVDGRIRQSFIHSASTFFRPLKN
jgi:hypothetical protein